MVGFSNETTGLWSWLKEGVGKNPDVTEFVYKKNIRTSEENTS